MNREKYSSVEDFVNDDSFVEWVLCPDPANNQYWSAWMERNPESVYLMERARSIVFSIKIKPLPQTLHAKDVQDISDRFLYQTSVLRERKMKTLSWITTTAALLLLGFGIWFWQQGDIQRADSYIGHRAKIRTISNAGKSSRLILLSDQSLVVLRPNSSLTFPISFGNREREVSLSGEAFFEIRPKSGQAFLVKAGKLTTEVLGTSFDVIAPKGKQEVVVVVKTGKVKVYNTLINSDISATMDSVILLPNQKAAYDPNSDKLKKIAVEPVMLSPLKAGKVFTFVNTEVAEVISKLQQAYGIDIVYDKEKLKGVTVTASLSKLSLEAKIKAICKSIGAQYEFRENQIRIY